MNKSFEALLQRVLKWAQEVLPSVTAVGSIIYNFLMRKIDLLERKVDNLKLKLKVKENHETVDKKFSDMSDADIVRDAAKSTASELERKGDE